jgi:hypothetical protein
MGRGTIPKADPSGVKGIAIPVAIMMIVKSITGKAAVL